jgi:hypothetical protein
VSACVIKELVLRSTVGIAPAHIKVIEVNRMTIVSFHNMDKISLPGRRLRMVSMQYISSSLHISESIYVRKRISWLVRDRCALVRDTLFQTRDYAILHVCIGLTFIPTIVERSIPTGNLEFRNIAYSISGK